MIHLFNKTSIFDVVQYRKQKIKESVKSLPPDYILSVSEDDLIQSLVAEYKFDVPILDENGITSDFGEAEIDITDHPHRFLFGDGGSCYVQGIQITFTIPFEGDPSLFQVQPQTFTYPTDGAEVNLGEGELLASYTRSDHNAAEIKRSYESFLRMLKQNLVSLKTSADQFNGQLETQIRQEIRQRKNKLLADAQMAEAIGLPIKRLQGAPVTYAVPVSRRSPKIERPPVPTQKFQPEPILAMEEYENILTIIRSMVRVMERSPKAFDDMGEEDLRTHFLVQLNGQYEGRATGETFNFQGKTDILIRENDRNVFIAECKFWHGEKQFLETIDQLLSYLSWRDTKTAILIFNRNANFTEVLKKIAEAGPKHRCYKRALATSESEFRYVFHQPADTNRELILSVLAFDVPTAEHRSKES